MVLIMEGKLQIREQLLESAAVAQRQSGATPIADRMPLLLHFAATLTERKQEFIRLITLEMSKPIVEAEAEVEKCAVTCEFYAQNAPRFLDDMAIASNASECAVVFDPLGVVLAIMPWNYPFWQFVRFAAPALAAGNGALLKHANNGPQCALAPENVFRQAGAPQGLVTTLLVEPSEVAEPISGS
jgi:succinate-semialdehyde dehydrogenase/glutarate-semialdehyde dehydrogenase